MVFYAEWSGTVTSVTGSPYPLVWGKEAYSHQIYVDDLIRILRSSGVDCYIGRNFAAALLYADDMAVIGVAKTTRCLSWVLHRMGYKIEWKQIEKWFFGKGASPTYKLKLDNGEIPWVDTWKYPGLTLKSGPVFGCCIKEKVSKFYRALNSILHIEGRSYHMVMLRLLEAHCIPILTYGIEIFHVSDRDENRKLRVAYNAVYRKVFGYSQRESVTELQHLLGRHTWEEMIEKRKFCFLQNRNTSPINSLVRAFGS